MVASRHRNSVLAADTAASSERYPFSYLVLAGVVFLCVQWQIPGESRDWQNYDNYYQLLRSEGLNIFNLSRFEPGFIIVSLILSGLMASNLVMHGVIASSAILMKSWAFNQISVNRQVYYVVIVFYVARYAPLHELTQVRVACSSALLLVAYNLVWRGKMQYCMLACALALAFHLSALFIIPILFMRNVSRSSAVIMSALVYGIARFGMDSLLNKLQDSVKVVIAYKEAGFGDELVNPLSSGLLLDWAMLVIGLSLWERIPRSMRQILFMEMIGMAFVYSSLDFPVLSHRLREMFSVFWVLFVAKGLQQETAIKDVSIIFVMYSTALYIYLYYYHNPLFL